jgi:hypothetical protein
MLLTGVKRAWTNRARRRREEDMAKRLLVLVAVLTAMLAAAVPALAQQSPPEPITVTGVLFERAFNTNNPNPDYGLLDEATGTGYITEGDGSIEYFVGERITVEGISRLNDGPPILEVISFAPADSPGSSPAGTSATLSFELAVEGELPQGTTFLGFIPAEGGIRVPLADPDDDGVYTGSTTVEMFGPGLRPVPPGTEPVSLPIQIVQNNGGNLEVIRDFGVVPIDGDKTFGARVNFERDGAGTALDSSTPDLDTEGPGSDSGLESSGSGDSSGSESNGSSGSGTSGSDGSGDGGSNSGSSGNDGRTSGTRGLLPGMGGIVLGTLLLGALLVGGGLLILRHAWLPQRSP